MKTAIIYASKHGTTEIVALSIAEKLSGEPFSLKKNQNPDISGFDMVILGSSIYMGQASGKMKAFCKTNEPVLLQKKIGLFVCGMHPEKEQREKELNDAYPAVLHEKAVAIGFLGGEFLFEKMNFIERLIIKKIAKTTESTHQIDRDAVDVFIAELLQEISK